MSERFVAREHVQTVDHVRQFGGVVAVPAPAPALLNPMQCSGQLFQGGRRAQRFVVERQNLSTQLADGGVSPDIIARRGVRLPGQVLDVHTEGTGHGRDERGRGGTGASLDLAQQRHRHVRLLREL
nr:hypothetical protein [Nocardia abscessus]